MPNDHKPQTESDALVERIKAAIDREVYCTVIIRPEHDPSCNGDRRDRCPIPVQDYGDTADLARAIATDLLRSAPAQQPPTTDGTDR